MDKLPDNLADAARTYAARDLPIIPLNGKVPAVRDWQKFVADAVNLRLWFDERRCNIGLRTGESRYVVVDADTDEAEAWIKRHLPETPMRARSGGGSLHRYFRAPPRKEVRNKQGWNRVRGLDIRGQGGCIVLPPSIHPETGLPYERITGLLPPEELPRFSPAWIYTRTRAKVQLEALCPDAGFMEYGAARWLAKVAEESPAVSGQGGHNATFRVCCKLTCYFGLSREVARRLLLAIYNPKCQPPWRESELLHKLHDAEKKRQGQ